MRLIFIHGWSVTDTGSYALLPEAIEARKEEFGLEIDVQHIWLGKYISFHDEVTLTDVARALERALRDVFQLRQKDPIPAFSCITHSTGGPMVRAWIDRFYGKSKLDKLPIQHLIMLSPANHGSPLAKLGKQRVGRIKAWFSRIEPGVGILKWLALGSTGQMELAQAFLSYNGKRAGFYPFVITGQRFDEAFYDFLNNYLTEKGSDGVVRVANANMNFAMLHLRETRRSRRLQHHLDPDEEKLKVFELELDKAGVQVPDPVPLSVVPNTSHTGKRRGMMGAILNPDDFDKEQVTEILKCLTVTDAEGYAQRAEEMTALTQHTQETDEKSPGQTFTQLVFRVTDDEGLPVTDYDLFLLGGANGQPGDLTEGFFMDRQPNTETPNHLVYYVNHTKLSQNQLTGFRLIARPETGFSHYHSVEYRAEPGVSLQNYVKPNETVYVSITLRRHVDKHVFRFDALTDHDFDPDEGTRNSFRTTEPSGRDVS